MRDATRFLRVGSGYAVVDTGVGVAVGARLNCPANLYGPSRSRRRPLLGGINFTAEVNLIGSCTATLLKPHSERPYARSVYGKRT